MYNIRLNSCFTIQIYWRRSRRHRILVLQWNVSVCLLWGIIKLDIVVKRLSDPAERNLRRTIWIYRCDEWRHSSFVVVLQMLFCFSTDLTCERIQQIFPWPICLNIWYMILDVCPLPKNPPSKNNLTPLGKSGLEPTKTPYRSLYELTLINSGHRNSNNVASYAIPLKSHSIKILESGCFVRISFP